MEVQVLLGEDTLGRNSPSLLHLNKTYPALCTKKALGRKQGELWEVDDAMLAVLDDLEGHRNFYEREVTRVILTEDEKGRTQCLQKECWLYFLKRYKSELLKLPFLQNNDNKGNNMNYKETFRRDIEVVRNAMMIEKNSIKKLINSA